MIVPEKKARAAAAPADISAQVAEAISLRDAKRIEGLLRDISMSPEAAAKRAEAIVLVAHHHIALNNVVIAAANLLDALKRDAAGDLARKLLAEPPHDDRELVRATAIRALVESGTVGLGDLPVIARSLNSGMAYVRAACQRALRGLTGRNRTSLEALVEKAADPGIEQLKLFVRALGPEAPVPEQPLKIAPAPRELSDEERAVRRAAKSVAAARRASEERIRRFREAEQRKAAEELKAKESRREPPGPRKEMRRQRAGDPVAAPLPAVEPHPLSAPGPTPHPSPSLAAFRNPALASVPLDALRVAMTRAATPDEFVAAAVEVESRFGLDAARAVGDRTLWFLSHPDFSRHEGLLMLSRALFS